MYLEQVIKLPRKLHSTQENISDSHYFWEKEKLNSTSVVYKQIVQQ